MALPAESFRGPRLPASVCLIGMVPEWDRLKVRDWADHPILLSGEVDVKFSV
jgi:hypothetical protein